MVGSAVVLGLTLGGKIDSCPRHWHNSLTHSFHRGWSGCCEKLPRNLYIVGFMSIGLDAVCLFSILLLVILSCKIQLPELLEDLNTSYEAVPTEEEEEEEEEEEQAIVDVELAN